MKKFAVIGDPVSHSLSPVMHNAAYKKLKIQAEYERIPVKADELNRFFERFRNGEWQGVNVTVPHKVSVLDHVDRICPEAMRIGAANTIWWDGNQLVADNSDGRGYIKSLLAEYELPQELYVVVIGAGGAAQAIVDAISQMQPEALYVVNRSFERADKLVVKAQMHHPQIFLRACEWQSLNELCEDADLIVNTTTLGMNQEWPDLNFLNAANKNGIVSDVVYRPQMTSFLQKAQSHGLKIHTGDGMLLYQAALSFEWMTGRKPDVAVMRGALEQELK